MMRPNINISAIEDVLILINYKTYKEATGENALRLSQDVKSVRDECETNIIVAPQIADIYRVSQMGMPAFAQHIDGIEFGSHTGHILAESVKSAGCSGTLINHSERRLTLAEIDSSIRAAKRAGLKAVVCSNKVATTAAISALQPDFVAIEPPELIGTGIPVSKANPEIVSKSVDAARGTKVLCGAGISSSEDVKAALELGTHGVLVASGIVKSRNPKETLEELVKGIK